jgi:hypothetical protein
MCLPPRPVLVLAALLLAVAGCEPIDEPVATVPDPTTAPAAPTPTDPDAAGLGTVLAAEDGLLRYLPALLTGPGAAAVVAGPTSAPPTSAPATSPPTLAAPPAVPGACPAGIARRQGDQVVVDGQPVFFFGVNTPFLLDQEYPEAQVRPLLAQLPALGVNTVRVWYFDNHDPERFQRLLDLGAELGLRYVVTLGDNVNKGRDWFFTDDDEEEYRPHVAATVSRFKDRPEILMWEVINEPNCGEAFDEECLNVIREWLTMATADVKALDPCHIVSTGMIGDGNSNEEERNYKTIHRKAAVGIVSQHRRATDKKMNEVDLAEDIERPIFYGEIYFKAYDPGCEPLDGGAALRERADVVKDDLRQAIEHGVDGYLLWELNGGRVKDRAYCTEFGFDLDDPLWPKLREAALPPTVPWGRAPNPGRAPG